MPSAAGPGMPESARGPRRAPPGSRVALRTPRVAGLAAGSSASPRLSPRLRERALPCAAPSEVQCARLRPGPLSQRHGARRLGGHRPALPRPAPGPRPRGSLGPSVEAPPGKKSDFLSAPRRVEPGIGRKSLDRSACALAVSPRFAEENQLPPKSCLPLPPKAPRRFVKRGARSEKCLWSRRKTSATVPSES